MIKSKVTAPKKENICINFRKGKIITKSEVYVFNSAIEAPSSNKHGTTDYHLEGFFQLI